MYVRKISCWHHNIISGFQFILALKVHDIVMMVKSVVIQSCFLMQLSLYSFIGNYLKCQMEEVGISIYQSTWHHFPVELMRNLLFIIMRTEMPVMLQAGNFIVINLSTYTSILKTSVSYLSVLRVMVEIWNIQDYNNTRYTRYNYI